MFEDVAEIFYRLTLKLLQEIIVRVAERFRQLRVQPASVLHAGVEMAEGQDQHVRVDPGVRWSTRARSPGEAIHNVQPVSRTL